MRKFAIQEFSYHSELTLTWMSSPLGALALIIVSCKDQSSLWIAVGCVKRVVNVVGRGTAGHDRGRYVNDVLTVLQIHGILKSVKSLFGYCWGTWSGNGNYARISKPEEIDLPPWYCRRDRVIDICCEARYTREVGFITWGQWVSGLAIWES